MILLDTNVVSEMMRATSDSRVDRWFAMHESDLTLPSIAIAELAFGIAKMPVGARRAHLATRLSEWRARYANRSPSFTAATAMIYGEIMAGARRNGHNMAVPDAQIAAIAQEHDYALATRNGKDFATTELTLIDPWRD